MILVYQSRSKEDKLIDEYKSIIPKSSVLNYTEESSSSVLDTIKKLPMFSDEWYIFVYSYRISASIIEELWDNGNNYVILICTSRSVVESNVLMLQDIGLEFKFMDGFLPSKEYLLEEIHSKLNITEFMANYLANRANWNMDQIYDSIQYLVTLKKITKKDIEYIIPLSVKASMDDVFEWFIGCPTGKDEKDLYIIIDRYRDSPRFLFEFFEERVNLCLWIFDNISNGYLTLSNCKEFRKDNSKHIKSYGRYSSLGDWRFSRLVNAFNHCSYEKLYLFRSAIEIRRQEEESLNSFLLLLKGGGN